ncbi:MAG: [Fe-Fe] hydrogenase large subunit C-terminal domain-containing protein, partial [Oscillospiraceae bacterium]
MKDYIGLKKSNCKNCYKCIRYCPVKSIRFSSDQAQIVNDECILCGHCFVVCPQNAKVIRSDVEIAKQLIAENEKVIVSLAPSFQANFAGAGLASLKKALIALGFSDVEETAIGATIVKKQYEKLIEQKSSDVIISSCCHTVNLLIRKYYPEALPSLAKIESPMSAHCRDIKARFPDAKTVFIGPCISKKAEADEYVGNVDCVLTFEELSDWMSGESVELDTVDGTLDDNTRARLFPTSGGILRTMDRSSDVYSYLVVDGLENCKLALKEISEHKLTRCFIEMSACAGSCIGGPALDRGREAPVSDYIFIDRFAGKHDYTVSD